MRALLENPSRQTAYMREWVKRHPEYRQRQKKNWPNYMTPERRELARQRAAAWYLANKDRAADSAKARYEADKEKWRAYNRAWVAANRDKNRAHMIKGQSVRRARKRANGIGEVDLSAVALRTFGCCGICGEQVERRFDYDHTIPIKGGGPHMTENLQLAHPSCNKRKGAKLEFRTAA